MKNDLVKYSPSVNPVFHHIPAQQLKDIGVFFSGQKVNEFIDPLAELEKDCTANEYLEVVSKVIDSKAPNYKGCRIALNSNLNISMRKKQLHYYHDKDVVNLMQFGFPLHGG